MKISISDLELAFMYSSAGADLDAGAYLDRETGAIRYTGEDPEEPEGGADALIDSERYLRVPNRHDLDLGRALVFDFVAQRMPDAESQVHEIFSRRGAYPRFKDLLDGLDLLEAWYDFEHNQTREALRDWAAREGIEVLD